MARKSKLPGIDPAALQEEVPSLSSARAAAPPPPPPEAAPPEAAPPPPPEPPAAPEAGREVVAVAPPSSALVPAPAPTPPPRPGAWHENTALRLSVAACLAFLLGYFAGKPFERLALPVAPPNPLASVALPEPGVVQALAAEREARARLDAVLAEFTTLLAAATEGGDFSSRLESLRLAAGGDAATLAALEGLRPFASGVPSLAALTAAFEGEAAPLLAPAAPTAPGLPARAMAWARGLMEREKLAARGAVIEAARAELARGLPEAAARRLAGLDPQAAMALQDWARAARARAGLDRAVRETAVVAVAAAARMAR